MFLFGSVLYRFPIFFSVFSDFEIFSLVRQTAQVLKSTWYKSILNVAEKLMYVTVCLGFKCDFLPLVVMCYFFHFFFQMDKLVLSMEN